MKNLIKSTIATALTAALLTTTTLSAAQAETLRFISWQTDDGGMGEFSTIKFGHDICQ